MVQVVMNGVGVGTGHHNKGDGFLNGKSLASPHDSGANKSSKSNKSAVGGANGVDAMQLTAGNGGGGGTRKLTKNEKRRQKNKQKKLEAQEGAETKRSMLASDGVVVASWPPPEPPKPVDDTVQVRIMFVYCATIVSVCICATRLWCVSFGVVFNYFKCWVGGTWRVSLAEQRGPLVLEPAAFCPRAWPRFFFVICGAAVFAWHVAHRINNSAIARRQTI